ncbi:hypothetical protein [uncultured Pseudonocardia sp.]|uniref:hypothetical protein n=1 Tax=uncultured Pseudonocardia sp. TaxID=211455 RepID=UPI002625C437|nr:hypothetical protein [uncultured Pseudonocardia sp.]
MTGYRPAVRRLCLVVDVEGYSVHDNLAQLGVQDRLDAVLSAGLSGAGVSRWRTERQDRGDGQLIILPAGIDEARALPGLLHGLLVALDRDRQDHAEPAVRLRMAVGQGVVHHAATGYVGRVVVEVCRLADAPAVRTELRTVPDADLCLVVTDDLYRDVIAHGYGGLPGDSFRVVEVRDPAKQFTATAWMRALNIAALPTLDAAAATAFAALPLAVAASTVTTRTLGELWADNEPDTDPSPTERRYGLDEPAPDTEPNLDTPAFDDRADHDADLTAQDWP